MAQDGIEGLLAKLNSLDVKRLAEDVGGALITEVQLGFASSTDPYGKPWKPVKRPGQPLLNHGILRNSYTYRTNGTQVQVGSNLVYAPVHQFGSKKRNIAARPMLPYNAGNLGNWAPVIRECVQRWFAKGGK